ncbi:ketoacyl reductase [Tamilnaduibacter salinus]|uniref:NADP-dependent 3-hydroxy acid dehydrogenase YdfG n=1 Tax=Tamilnaduibacter salinus TaxID=1484056 RepID=A0A2A2I3E1_9GAMM|nr:SDR family oxidoreductase [Tamilnaduibacter salinus]PAV25826.1 ketoacyl reductase [Tamilnaduibacter salinus]
MPLPQPTPDARAVITGASSGIGERLAHELAQRGHSLMLVARRVDKLETLAEQLQTEHGVTVDLRPCDLTDREARATLREELANQTVSVLCNNAGFATFGKLWKSDPERERQEVELNVAAVQDLTMAVLPGMVSRGAGAVLIVGSTAGIQPLPGAATYSATKAFANTFSEAIHSELQGTGVTCTLLAPGPVHTEFMQAANVPKAEHQVPGWAWLTADQVARSAVAGLENGQRTVVPGALAKLFLHSGRHTPRSLLLPLVRRTLNRIG